MTKENIDILLKSIIKIEDCEGNHISFNSLELKEYSAKYTNSITLTLFIDGIPCVGKKRNYQITYQCRCGRTPKILLVRYLTKNCIRCSCCAQDKRFGELGHNNPNRKIPRKNYKTRFIYNFNDENSEFKNNYFKTHLTSDEFDTYLPFIYQINDILITQEIIQKIKYYPHVVCNNGQKYTSKIEIDDIIETIKEVYLKCEICGKIHKIHIYNLRNKDLNYIKCKQCGLTNTKFPIKLYKNTNLTYQSSIEYEFLRLCEKYNIQVQNGLNIPYIWNNKNKTYISDFYLPDYKLIIETKSNHIYYRMQMQNGKQIAKNNGAILFAQQNKMEFRFLFDNMFNDFFSELLQKEIV